MNPLVGAVTFHTFKCPRADIERGTLGAFRELPVRKSLPMENNKVLIIFYSQKEKNT